MEGPAIDLQTFVQQYPGPIAAVVGAFVAALVSGLLVQARRIDRLARRVDALTRGADGASLEAVVGQHLDRVRDVVRELDLLENRTAAVEEDVRRALGRVGFVRYNPFEDTGGNQSFALAILDSGGNGFVVSSLHARGGTRVYAKSIEAGRAETALSAEESEALTRALGGGGTAR